MTQGRFRDHIGAHSSLFTDAGALTAASALQLQKQEKPQNRFDAVSDGISVVYGLHGVQKVGGSNPLAPTTPSLPQSPLATGLVASPSSSGGPFRESSFRAWQRQAER